MSRLDDLKATKSLGDLAKLLGYKASTLSYVLYKKEADTLYTTFEIPKKAGGMRTISAPNMPLKDIQRRMSKLLYECWGELEANRPGKPLSHGFLPGRSIITNAYAHKRRRYVLNVDIENFFGTINFGRVRGFFLSNKNFQLSAPVATAIARISTFKNSLPQGSPCSPIVSNFIGQIVDVKLVKLAKTYGLKYSRYADDLTFSTNQRLFPDQVAAASPAAPDVWTVGDALQASVNSAGFVLSAAKTRMHVRPSRQVVTGLTVNAKVNVPAQYYRRARSMCHSLFSTGQYFVAAGTDGGVDSGPHQALETFQTLEGRLSYIHYVKDAADDRDEAEKLKEPSAAEKLYRKFLFYRYFMAPEKPIVICEGVTDNIYLRCAIARLSAQFPILALPLPNGQKYGVSFLKYSARAARFLRLTGGVGSLAHFINKYQERASKYPEAPMRYPVLIVIDNDKGLPTIAKATESTYSVEISNASPNEFFSLSKNLYVIKTPNVGANNISFIEQYFEAGVLQTVLNGKVFNPNKQHDAPGEYGKTRFANEVIRKNFMTINFSGFVPLLTRMTSALTNYQAALVAQQD